MLTYACYAELRELIPNGHKMSIDRLLHRTIKQMYFLRSVAKHAKGLAKHQLLKDRKDQKDHFKNIISGVTRACEIENEMMICPLVVEDLSHPGQMLIRILCQEQGYFLEIVDMIRGFGLNILKGCMEVHEAKIHAHYIVEAEENQFVSRHEIFSSIVHILGLADASNEFGGDDLLGNVRQGGIGLLNDSVQSTCGAPTSKTEAQSMVYRNDVNHINVNTKFIQAGYLKDLQTLLWLSQA
ncbi:unnamed protein product [Cuscuta campestris]|uniref:BHLH domain-containing protein n=1 Tax=Cuscuta campestris TaxID=132261 RepID=A0A484LR65_9ASTE|nr:unnamed protein product [Cuscuta campestris]